MQGVGGGWVVYSGVHGIIWWRDLVPNDVYRYGDWCLWGWFCMCVQCIFRSLDIVRGRGVVWEVIACCKVGGHGFYGWWVFKRVSKLSKTCILFASILGHLTDSWLYNQVWAGILLFASAFIPPLRPAPNSDLSTISMQCRIWDYVDLCLHVLVLHGGKGLRIRKILHIFQKHGVGFHNPSVRIRIYAERLLKLLCPPVHPSVHETAEEEMTSLLIWYWRILVSLSSHFGLFITTWDSYTVRISRKLTARYVSTVL
jgi:hypothetical protein